MPCRSQCSKGHRLLGFIQLCLVLPPPSSSSCSLPKTCCARFFFQISFHVFFGRRLCLWPCGVHCNACLATMSSFLLNIIVSKPVPILTCVSHTAHVIAIGWTSVRLSVCPSLTEKSYSKTIEKL